jgi:serine/threonine protein kinase
MVYLSSDSASGLPLVTKIYVAGSMAEAEGEFAMARLAAGAGVVVYRSVGIDAAANRPCVTSNFETGTDLDRLVAEFGSLPAALACRLLAPVAATLARLHALRVQDAPAGLCHGDVKPRNLLRTATTTLLLDFEHARPISASHRADAVAFTGGSHGSAPPEATQGLLRLRLDATGWEQP